VKVPQWTVPALVAALIVAGVGGARLFAIPTVTVDLANRPMAGLETVVLTVDGVRCTDTARTAASTLEGAAGVVRFTAYASYSRVEVAFDPALTSADQIVALLEGPVYDAATGEFRFGLFAVADEDQE